MTTRRQRLANRLNALRSTGPKTDSGKRSSSANSMRHGLTIPVELSPWAKHLQSVQTLLSSEGFGAMESRQLGLCILDFERNLEQQRQQFLVYQQRYGVIDHSPVNQESDFESLLADPGLEQWEQEYLWVRQKMVRARSQYLCHLKASQGRQARRHQQQVQLQLRNIDRHLRRSANQLQRRCRDL